MPFSLDRRDFIRTASLGAAAWMAGCHTVERAEVVVIGAGMSGLTAAGELVRAGRDVVVLEAQFRPGGRVLTLRSQFDDGMYAEAGAVFVPAGHEHVRRLAREHQVGLVPATRVRGGPDWYHIAGELVKLHRGEVPTWPRDLGLTNEERELDPSALRARYLSRALDRLGDPRHPSWPGPTARQYDSLTVGELLRQAGASPGAVRILRLGYLDEWGDGVDHVAALPMLRDLVLNASSSEMSRVVGGTDRLPRAMAAALGERVRYGAAVRRMRSRGASIEIEYADGAGVRTIRAERVISAVPFSVLRMLRIDVPLSGRKRSAIDSLSATSVTRVFVQTRRLSWEPDAPESVPAELPIMHAIHTTAGQSGEAGILEAFVTGARARRLAAMHEPQRVGFSTMHLDKIWPGLSRMRGRSTSWAWDADPWARGDYAWFRPGQLTAWLPALAAPEGRLHFAGDHTSSSPGWMQGAVEAGLRAAAEISHP